MADISQILLPGAETPQNIKALKIPYGTCSTAAGTAAKAVTIKIDNGSSGNNAPFVLEVGTVVAVKFTVTNTAANPTLNVNSTGAKVIYYRGANIAKGALAANRTYQFVYNGTQWEFIGDIDTDTNTNYYHTTGSWSDLTYTATANGGAGAGALAFTIPTGTTSSTVAVGNHTHNYAGSSSAGGSATSVELTAASADSARNVWFSWQNDINKAAYDDDFKYNPATDLLTVTNINSSGYIESSSIGKDIFIAYPDGGTLSDSTNGATGYIKIKLPISYNKTMIRFTVSLYEYIDDDLSSCVDYYISGFVFQTGNTWTRCSAYSIGKGKYTNLDVQFGNDGSNCAVLIGSASSKHYYLKAVVHDVVYGYAGGTFGRLKSGWEVSITTDDLAQVDTTITNTGGNLLLPKRLGGATTSQKFYPIFQFEDHVGVNNTSYYKDDGFSFNFKKGTASVEGNSQLVLGNSIEATTDENSTGVIVLYSSSTNYGLIKQSAVTSSYVTHTLPPTSGTILNTGTTSFTQTLTSGTKIGSIEINGASTDIYAPTNTDTKTNVTLYAPTSVQTVYPTFCGSGALDTATGLRYFKYAKNKIRVGSTVATRYSSLILGNDNVTEDDAAVYGSLKLCSQSTGGITIRSNYNATEFSVHVFPTTGGTILNTGTTSFTQSLTSGTAIGTLKIDGEDTVLYAPTNTDTKVRQTLTSADTNRPLLMAYSGNTTTTTNVDNVSYRNNSIYANPSTGTIYSTVIDTGKVQLANGSLEDGVNSADKPKLTLSGPGNEKLEFYENFAEFSVGTYGGVIVESTKTQISHSSSIEINSGGGVNITSGTGGATINSGSGALNLQANTTNGNITLTGADTQINTSQIHLGTTSSTTAMNIGNSATTISQTGKSVTISATSSAATNTLTLSASGPTAGNVSVEAGGPSGGLTLKTASAGSINLTAGVTGSINITSGTTSGSINITAKTWPTGSGTNVVINSGQLVKNSSSIRYKDNIDYDLDKEDYHQQLMNFKPCTYEYKELPGEQSLGLIAEDVYDINPQLVNYDDDFEIESYRDRDITTILIIEAQEKDKKIKELEDRINQLEYLVNQLTGLSNNNLWN